MVDVLYDLRVLEGLVNSTLSLEVFLGFLVILNCILGFELLERH